MEYLPEWKIYLWKKLLLDKHGEDTVRKISDFIFFDEEDIFAAGDRFMRNSIVSAQNAYWDGYNEAGGQISQNTHNLGSVREKSLQNARGAYRSIDAASVGTPIDDLYYSEPRGVLMALVELATDRPSILQISDIVIGKGYIARYRQERGKYLAQEEKIRVAGIISGSGGGRKPNANYYNDKYCSLGESIFSKVEKSQELDLDYLKNISINPTFFWDFLSFKIQIDKTALVKKLSEYIHHFMNGELIAPPRVRYYSYQQQHEKVSAAIELIAGVQGEKNILITLVELAGAGKWNHRESDHFRFYETILALWITGQIEIHDLRKEEVVISLTDSFETEKETGEEKIINVFDLKKTISTIKSASDFETAKKKWFPVKEILDAIHKKSPPLDDADGIVKEQITLTDLTPEQAKMLPIVLKHASDSGIISSSRPDGKKRQHAVISSEPAKNFLAGKNLWINSIEKFEEYRGQIADLCYFINAEGKIETPEDKEGFLLIQLKNRLLTINKNTGDVKLSDVEGNLNPEGQDFKALLKLSTNKDYKATYEELIGETPTKTNKRTLSFILRNVKEALGILPKKKAKNKDIISNIKGHGYRLIT